MSEYIELNLNNYDEHDVAQLNSWAIEAVAAIEAIVREDAFDGLPEHHQEQLLALVGLKERPSP